MKTIYDMRGWTGRALSAVAVALALASCGGRQAAGEADDKAEIGRYVWTAHELPALTVAKGTEGVAGHLINKIGDRVAVAGGANFPNEPAAEGGKKAIHKYAFLLFADDSGKGMWNRTYDLPERVAYAASAMTPKGLLYVGGNNGTGSVGDVRLWLHNDSHVELTPFPTPVENAAAAYSGGYVYVAGGQTPEGPSRALWRMAVDDDLRQGKFEWERMPDMPGQPRVQCSAAMLGGKLYVAGGYNPVEGTVDATLIAFDPATAQWDFVDSLRKPGDVQTATLIGGTMLADSLTHRLLFIGGVDATVFYEAISRPMRLEVARRDGNKAMTERLEKEAKEYMHHEPEWYKFNDELISYDFDRQEFRHELSHPSLARAGAAVLMDGDRIYVVNGELKPGIRANTAVLLKRTKK